VEERRDAECCGQGEKRKTSADAKKKQRKIPTSIGCWGPNQKEGGEAISILKKKKETGRVPGVVQAKKQMGGQRKRAGMEERRNPAEEEGGGGKGKKNLPIPTRERGVDLHIWKRQHKKARRKKKRPLSGKDLFQQAKHA